MTTRLLFTGPNTASPRTAGAVGLSRVLLALAILLVALPAMIPLSVVVAGCERAAPDRVVSDRVVPDRVIPDRVIVARSVAATGAGASGLLHADSQGTPVVGEPRILAVASFGCEWSSWDREPQPEPDNEDDSLVSSLLESPPLWLIAAKRHGLRPCDSIAQRRLWCKAHAVRAPPM